MIFWWILSPFKLKSQQNPLALSAVQYTLQSYSHWHTYQRLGAGMLDMADERCPAVLLVTKTISVLALGRRDKQDVNSHHTVLNSTKGHKPHLTLAFSFLKPSCLWAGVLKLLKGRRRPTSTSLNSWCMDFLLFQLDMNALFSLILVKIVSCTLQHCITLKKVLFDSNDP